jgi:hypothetical protein
MQTEKDKIRLDLSLVSSILNHAGYKGLLNYLSLETYKRVNKDEYVDFHAMGEFAFIKDEKTWISFMDKLVGMKLAVRKGNYYISRTKKKDWRQFQDLFIKQSKRFNGFLHFDMTEIYILKESPELMDLLYLSIHQQVIKGKSISRGFIKDLTGVDKNLQRKIEDRQEDRYLEKITHHIPVGYGEEYEKKVGDIPTFNGHFNPRHMKCFKTSKKKSNCKVIQLGNKVKIKDLRICEFEYPKKAFKKHISNLNHLNDSSLQSDEVQEWNDLNMVLDTSESSKSNKFRGMLSTKDRRYASWKDFKNYDYDKINVISEDGTLIELRDTLNQN